jgi:transaldolase/glucose-6-phosphate isomerase
VQSIQSSLPEALESAVRSESAAWQSGGKMQRLWSGDATLWTGADETSWLGWLGIVDEQLASIAALQTAAKDAQAGGFQHILLLGMGGSSLCPEVLRMTFGKIAGFPELHVLDSTDPAQVKAVENAIQPARTLFVVASKSGSTLEPNILKQYFFAVCEKAVGAGKAGQNFIAITDPESKMQKVAAADKFRHIFFGVPSIGGRYSALSNFGMVPAALMGLDTKRFLDRAEAMSRLCGGITPVQQNPAAMLGLILGSAARLGRDKLTLITSPAIFDLGAWLEQLVAESTGKIGRGVIPVDREPVQAPDAYSHDRVFVYVRLQSNPDAKQDAAVAALEKAAHAVVRLTMHDVYDLGAEFFLWEIATAVAGAVIGINAFNQPDVEASKIATRTLTSAYEQTGSLPAETPILEDAGIKLFADERNATDLSAAAGSSRTLVSYLKAHFGRIKAGDYFAVLGYIQMNSAHEDALQDIRRSVLESKRVATCLGFGPRFLHSTGQAYKGGPNSGVFLQITCDDAADLPVPQQKYSFGTVKAAQARGDFQVLADRGRRALRVHLGKNLAADLERLQAAVKQALV